MRKLGKRHEQAFVFVATPCYQGKIDADTYLSCLDATAVSCHADRVGLASRYIRTHFATMGNGAFIELARNTMVKMFLETECTHLFFIDGDLKFESRAFVDMVRLNRPIMAGAYRRRQEPENYPIMLQPDPKTQSLWFKDNAVMCSRVPTGFMCIRRDVIEEMVADPKIGAINTTTGKIVKSMKQPDSKDWPEIPWLFYTKFDENDHYVGEDFSFCDDYVKKYGEYIPVYPDWDFVHGGYKCNLNNYLNDKHDAALSIVNKEWAPTVPHVAAATNTEKTEAA